MESTRGAELTGIHTVSGRFYSQVVVKLDTPVLHDVLVDRLAGTIKLALSPLQSVKEIGEIQIFPYDRFIKNITSELIEERGELTIFLKNAEVQAEVHSSDWPFELVLEIRPLGTETPAITEREESPPAPAASKPSSNLAVQRSGPRAKARPIAIRTGFHESYSRIVVEFDKHVDHKVSLDKENRTLVVNLRPVDSTNHLLPPRIHPQDRYLNKLDYQVGDSTLKIVASLKNPDIQFDSRQLGSPFRIVVDVRPLTSPLEKVSQKDEQATTPESVPARTENQPDSVLSAILRGEDETNIAMLDSTAITTDNFGLKIGPDLDVFKLDLSSGSQGEPAPVPPSLWASADDKLRMFIKVFIGFIIFDTLLAGIYFIRRRKSKENRQPIARTPVSHLNQSMSYNREFIDALASAVRERSTLKESTQPTGAIAAAGVPATVKIDHMIDSLSTALGSLASLEESDVEIDPYVNEIHSISNSSGLTVEDIIGRDGQEFVRNLKRLQNK